MKITSDTVTEYLHGFYRPVNEFLKVLREEGEANAIPIILKETENFLNILLELRKPKKILEIGTAIGYSSIYFATMCPDAEIYTIEKGDEMYECALNNIAKAGMEDRIHVYHGDGEEQVNVIADEGISDFDFVFIDAAKSHYKRFFDASLKVCEKDALIISDNILQRGMTAADILDVNRRNRTRTKYMKKYLEYINDDERFDTSFLSAGDGLALVIYRGEHE